METMNKNKYLIPELRFPEFKNEGEWIDISIESVGDIVTGGTPSKEENEYWGGDFVWITAQDFKEKYIYNSVLKLTKRGKEKSRIIPKNSVLVTCIASIGLNGINKIECATNQQINSIICNSSNHFEFIYYAISKNINILKNLAGQTAVPIISKSVFEKFIIQKPQNPIEQQKIASCFSSLDELITVHSQKLELLKQHKKGLMQNLFPQEGEKVPKYRFKEFENDGEWVSHIIGDFIESHKGGAPLSPSDFVDKSDFEVIPKKAINEGGLLNMSVTSPTYCTENFYNNNKKSVVDSSFLIITLRDLVPSGPSIGYIVKFNGIKKYILAQGVYGLKPKNTIVPDFLIQFSNTIRYRKLVNAAMVGSTQVHIRNSEFLNLPIQAPKKQEQQKIASCLSSLDQLIAAQIEKIEQLKLHKKGLMQGVFPKVKE